MNINGILALNIPDIHPAYGGVRGKTMSSRSQGHAWPVIKDAGVHTIIDLRNDGMNQRMQNLCEEYRIEYFYYPVDNRADVVESMVSLFPDFCGRIDRCGFYIACAMGLHRTDIALSTYWVFYGTDKGKEPPTLQGYLKESATAPQRYCECLMPSMVSSWKEMARSQCPLRNLSEESKSSTSKARETTKSNNLITRLIMEQKYTICFVCTGNACRSPFAECVLKSMLEQEGMDNIEVFSRGTLDWGENPRDANMVRIASELDYDLKGMTTPITHEKLQEADCIVIFDAEHRNAITRVLDYTNWDRIVMFDKLAFGTDTAVMDPHYQTDAIYRSVASHIVEGCKRIIEQWRDNPPTHKV